MVDFADGPRRTASIHRELRRAHRAAMRGWERSKGPGGGSPDRPGDPRFLHDAIEALRAIRELLRFGEYAPTGPGPGPAIPKE